MTFTEFKCVKEENDKGCMLIKKKSLFTHMSRFILSSSSRLFTKRASPTIKKALFSTTFSKLNQQNDKKITHFGFRDVAEEEKESLGKLTRSGRMKNSLTNQL